MIFDSSWHYDCRLNKEAKIHLYTDHVHKKRFQGHLVSSWWCFGLEDECCRRSSIKFSSILEVILMFYTKILSMLWKSIMLNLNHLILFCMALVKAVSNLWEKIIRSLTCGKNSFTCDYRWKTANNNHDARFHSSKHTNSLSKIIGTSSCGNISSYYIYSLSYAQNSN